MSWQGHRAGRGQILMFLTTFLWWKWLKLSVVVARYPPVPQAKDRAFWPVLGHAAGQKHLVRAQEHDHGQTTSNRHLASAVAAEGAGSFHLCHLSLLPLCSPTECVLPNEVPDSKQHWYHKVGSKFHFLLLYRSEVLSQNNQTFLSTGANL